MNDARDFASVVDDDESVLEALPDLLREFGFTVRAFTSAEEFLASPSLDETGCLLFDVAMPGMSGLDLQDELRRRHRAIPIGFITAGSAENVGPRAMAGGAVACLFKPFSSTALLEAITVAPRVR